MAIRTGVGDRLNSCWTRVFRRQSKPVRTLRGSEPVAQQAASKDGHRPYL